MAFSGVRNSWESVARKAFPEQLGPFGFLTLRLGNVLPDAGHAHRMAGSVTDDVTSRIQRADGPVGADDSVLEPERLAVRERAPDCLLDKATIVGKDAFEKSWIAPDRVAARDAVDLLELLGPPYSIGDDVPFPTADMSDALGLHEPLFASRELFGPFLHAELEIPVEGLDPLFGATLVLYKCRNSCDRNASDSHEGLHQHEDVVARGGNERDHIDQPSVQGDQRKDEDSCRGLPRPEPERRPQQNWYAEELEWQRRAASKADAAEHHAGDNYERHEQEHRLSCAGPRPPNAHAENPGQQQRAQQPGSD